MKEVMNNRRDLQQRLHFYPVIRDDVLADGRGGKKSFFFHCVLTY